MLLSSARWEIIAELGSDLVDKLKTTRGPQRAKLAAQAARDALSALALVPGLEATAARRLIAALAAAQSGSE